MFEANEISDILSALHLVIENSKSSLKSMKYSNSNTKFSEERLQKLQALYTKAEKIYKESL